MINSDENLLNNYERKIMANVSILNLVATVYVAIVFLLYTD